MITEQELEQAFLGPIEPVRPTVLYRAGLVVVALAMIVLPLVYLGIVGAVLYGLSYHATAHVSLFEGTGGMKGRLLAYITPLVVGGLLVLFLIKPLFARRSPAPAAQGVTSGEQAILWHFVERICAAVGSPRPTRIELDCRVNASAGFRRGVRSMLRNDLVLTIGLPLVSGMTLRNFAGVLAHEFGHFSQGAGMRLTYIIRGVNAWFFRVVHERDAWDARIESWSKNNDIRIMIILRIARAFIWLTRRILQVLMMAGHGISCFALRQMEFDADRYEARLAGSDTFHATCLRLQELGIATQSVMPALRDAWKYGRLADDFPGYLASRADDQAAETRDAIQSAIDKGGTGFWDSHPADKDRIASAARENTPGVFHLERPATSLFQDYAAVARTASLDYYRELTGDDCAGIQLVSATSIQREAEAAEAGARAMNRFFHGLQNSLVPFRPFPGGAAAPADPDALDAARTALEEADELWDALCRATQAFSLEHGKVPYNTDDFGVPEHGLAAVEQAKTACSDQLAATCSRVGPAQQALGDDLGARMSALRETDPAAHAAAQPFAAVVDTLGGLFDVVTPMRLAYASIAMFYNIFEDDGAEPRIEVIEEMKRLVGGVHGHLHALVTALADIPNPYRDDGATLASFVVPELPEPDEIGSCAAAADTAITNFFATYYRALGDLALPLQALHDGAELNAAVA